MHALESYMPKILGIERHWNFNLIRVCKKVITTVVACRLTPRVRGEGEREGEHATERDM